MNLYLSGESEVWKCIVHEGREVVLGIDKYLHFFRTKTKTLETTVAGVEPYLGLYTLYRIHPICPTK